jgi:hypothetical protein
VLEGSNDPAPLLALVSGESKLARFHLGFVVGRHPALCDKTLKHGSTSRHCQLGPVAGALFIEDPNSLNGTLVESLGRLTASASCLGRQEGR